MVANPPSNTPALWHNQEIILYHGTLNKHANSILTLGIDIEKSRNASDFGRGFYLTTLKYQAEAWADQSKDRISDPAERNAPENSPVIMAYQVQRDDLAKLDALWFIRGSHDADDFWSFVFHCREGKSGHGRYTNHGLYDIVAGPVAAFWRQKTLIAGADQVSFHSDRAIGLLVNPSIIPVV
jgi:hypothetical protein